MLEMADGLYSVQIPFLKTITFADDQALAGIPL